MNRYLSRIKWTMIFFSVCFITSVVSAQNSDEAADVTSTYYIKNATIIQKPGMTMEGGSIIIKNGLIHSIGKNLAVPFDAMVIEADSMYVYAGFIDGASHTGMVKKERPANNGRGERVRVKDPGNPLNSEVGITPEIKAIDKVVANDKSIAEMRKYGFTISHVVPEGMMLPGKGAVISLGEGATGDLTINPVSSQFAQWQSARGAYPSTIIGMIAKWRDLYHNAKNMGAYAAKYNVNSVGLPRPSMDAATEALIPVVNKKLPVFFVAEKALDIHKTLSLKKELDLLVVLTDVQQVGSTMEMIKRDNIPLLLSISLPKEVKEEKKEKKDEAEKDDMEDDEVDEEEMEKDDKEKEKKKKDEKDTAKEPMDPAVKAMKKRQLEAYKEYVSQASELEKNGVAFGFSFIDGKAKDFKGNIKKMIESGLSENAALAAVTTNPAQILGISKVAGTVEAGKMAHLVVTDKPFFADKSNIRFVFVDGKKYEYEAKKEKKKKKAGEGEGGEMAKIGGTWDYTIEIPGMTRKGNFKISQNGEEIEVEMSNEESPSDFLECDDESLSGTSMTFGADVENGGMSFNLKFSLDFDGDDFEGNVDVGEFGSFPIKGSRISSPE